MSYPNYDDEDIWTPERIAAYANTALTSQPPVPAGVQPDISQDPDLFSVWQAPESRISGAAKAPAGTPYTSTALAMVTQARTYLGIGESPANTNEITREYNSRYHIGTNSFAWCDASITLEAVHSNNEGPVLGGKGKCFAYVPAHAAWFQSIGRLHWGMPTKMGQVVFFRWDRKKKTTICDHVGLVESVNGNGTVTTLEGNISDGFRREVRDSTYIVGYGDPDYLPANPNEWPGRYLQLRSPMMHGDDVTWVQLHLDVRGYKLAADSVFGKLTKAAVVKFQTAAKLEADGIVGPATWKALV